MHSNTLLLGLGAATLAAAKPMGRRDGHWQPKQWSDNHQSYPANAPTYTQDVPFPTETNPDGSDFRYGLSNGSPTAVASAALADINNAAGGSLPTGVPPPPKSDSLTSLQLIAFNELAEVAFFTELLQNITDNVQGYQIGGADSSSLNGLDAEFVIRSLEAIQAQEELHLLNANGALIKFGSGVQQAVQPCEYAFGVETFEQAIGLAQTFTDVVLGTLQVVQQDFGVAGDNALIRGVGSVIGQEGEQEGFFRLFQGKRPSAQPFLTTSARPFAFSALNQNFVVPGSCPQSLSNINLTIFEPLTIVNPPVEGDGTLTLSIQSNNTSFDNVQLVYVSGQNLFTIDGSDFQTPESKSGGTVEFVVDFPQQTNLFDGLVIAAITSKGNFANVDEVAAATLFGPGLIEVD